MGFLKAAVDFTLSVKPSAGIHFSFKSGSCSYRTFGREQLLISENIAIMIMDRHNRRHSSLMAHQFDVYSFAKSALICMFLLILPVSVVCLVTRLRQPSQEQSD